ncbi:Phage NinG rap recombination [Pseudomonas chlororaphis subsp. piscium]|uniref:recombination protein NinG n=1 Tax=Pseudomonas chlororaphis TaxID=587753 RepID=UPI0006A57147|nr:recombination protein NinG [Pseudomonas chlororaphis]AZC30108.1 Phage NinG rap recombination [Pseudomonas chlororaphis subsp. piscium]WDG94041.1 recombination protein NinG [Pseudomonas chlororaphis]SDT24707.1 Bacteriophage Lambda NinG protein [Pseudomonas chlororaphis]
MTRTALKEMKAPKPKKCKNPACGISFPPQRLGQRVCSPKCALAIAPTNQERARKAIQQRERREIRTAKERVKSRADHMREAQALFNQWIRLRDAHLGCVSCDKPATWNGQWHASHFLSVGSSPEHRFNPLNVHKACSVCNNHLSGNIHGYRPELERRIGIEAVEALFGPCEPKRYTIPELQEIKVDCWAKIKELKGRAA